VLLLQGDEMMKRMRETDQRRGEEKEIWRGE
jgi:hypothetical protein